jgi:hypothetical protein
MKMAANGAQDSTVPAAAPAWVRRGTILTVLGGGRGYGLAHPDSDWDYRGVSLPPVRWLVGFGPEDQGSHTWTHHGSPAEWTIHTLAKCCRLALRGNPNLLEILWCRDAEVRTLTVAGAQLRGIRGAFLSRGAYDSFAKYAASQLDRMTRHDGHHGGRQESIAAYGYDPKNAAHLVRLLLMGRDLLRDGVVQVWRDADATLLNDIRGGRYTLEQVRRLALDLREDAGDWVGRSPLPSQPDRETVEAWLIDIQSRWVAGDETLVEEVSGGGADV